MAKMAARRPEVFCPAMFLLFIFISFTTRKESFCQPDEISSKGITNGVNESFSFSSMFAENQKRYIRYSKKSLCLLLLVCGDISPNPGPQPSPSLKRFTRKRGFKILHQNINGISEKIDLVRGILQHKNIQIFAFTEIHLNASVTDAKIFVDGYKIERLDRKNGTNGTHGGAICFIRSDVNYERKNLEIKGIEAIWIGVSFTKAKPIPICFMYRSPDSSEYLDEHFLTYFDNMIETVDYENKETILTGDFN